MTQTILPDTNPNTNPNRSQTMTTTLTPSQHPAHARSGAEKIARGTLQEAGELAVLSDASGATRHRYALVIAFDSEEALRQAVTHHRCAYRDGQHVQELTHG